MERFYQDLPVTTNLAELMQGEHYTPLPDDWYVVVADIVGSTEALKKGQYKAINATGAAVIMALLNLTRPLEVPFVFGGDGASIYIPPEYSEKARKILKALKRTAQKSFGLDLRAGIIPYQVIRNAGYQINIAKYQVSRNYTQAFINGGGSNYAEELLKDAQQGLAYSIDEAIAAPMADLKGLECRWDTVPSPNGETVALLVKVNSDSRDVQNRLYSEILQFIEQVYGGRDQYNPLRASALALTYNLGKLSVETGLRVPEKGTVGKIFYKLKIIWENILGDIFMSTDSNAADINWGEYRSDLVANSDFLKFEDMLRLVISGTGAQREKLTSYLEKLAAEGQIIYGMHVSGAALVTCLVFEREKNHIHFIDADRGGYAMAALQLKQQVKQLGDKAGRSE